MLLHLNTAAANALPRNFAMKATLCGYDLTVSLPRRMYTPGVMSFEGAVIEGIRGQASGTITVNDDGTANPQIEG